MKLDRNTTEDRQGKYALLNLRRFRQLKAMGDPACTEPDGQILNALTALEAAGILDWGETCSEGEFFVMRLRDLYAGDGLAAYAVAAFANSDREYASEVADLASRAGRNSPFCKKPD